MEIKLLTWILMHSSVLRVSAIKALYFNFYNHEYTQVQQTQIKKKKLLLFIIFVF